MKILLLEFWAGVNRAIAQLHYSRAEIENERAIRAWVRVEEIEKKLTKAYKSHDGV